MTCVFRMATRRSQEQNAWFPHGAKLAGKALQGWLFGCAGGTEMKGNGSRQRPSYRPCNAIVMLRQRDMRKGERDHQLGLGRSISPL